MEFRNEDSKLCSYRKSYSYKVGFLNTGTIGILSWIIFCSGRQSYTCEVFSRIPGYPLDANSTPQLWQTRMAPDIARCILEEGEDCPRLKSSVIGKGYKLLWLWDHVISLSSVCIPRGQLKSASGQFKKTSLRLSGSQGSEANIPFFSDLKDVFDKVIMLWLHNLTRRYGRTWKCVDGI